MQLPVSLAVSQNKAAKSNIKQRTKNERKKICTIATRRK
jgi:hypothetical protein